MDDAKTNSTPAPEAAPEPSQAAPAALDAPTPAKALVTAPQMSDRLRDFAKTVADDFNEFAAHENAAHEALDKRGEDRVAELRDEVTAMVDDKIHKALGGLSAADLDALNSAATGGASVFEDVDLAAHYKAARAGG